ncbi:MAG TPA: M20 family metallopeptidase [Anaerolineales bacterium]|nr:M20 family metallopeptidase [Anaerolineales bacterium]
MLEKARSIQPQLVAWRRDFHMHPELGFQENRTSQRVAEIAEELGCSVRRGVGRTGVVAELGSGRPVIALRADMDALPLQEDNPVEYASQTPGVMHACGHDSHTAMLLGVLAILAKEEFPGTVRCLFQPSEEVADPQGISGAPAMIADGAMQGVDMVLAQHVDPSLPVGDVSVEAGPSSGGVDSWYGTILGKGGHGAHPYETVDPFYLCAHVLFALNAIPSRHISPFDPAVVSVGSLHGGMTENVIPDRVELTGTLRFMDPAVQKKIHAEIERAFQLVRPLGGDYRLRFEIGTPPMQNHPDAVELIRRAAGNLLGREHVVLPEKGLGAEDFGCFTELAPGAMFNLGTLIAGDERYGHNPRFDIDENAMPIGTAVLAEATLSFLNANH